MKLTAAIFLTFVRTVCAQSASAPAFDVVSIKPSDPLQGSSMDRMHPGWYELRNLTLVDLIALAWGVERYQVVGATGWQTTAGWDIDARFPAGAASNRIPLMMQLMLAERFQLQARQVSREAPIYRLLVAKGGPKMAESKDGSEGISSGQTMISTDSVDMPDFASFLSLYLKRKVIDATHLTAHYKIDLRFSPLSLGQSETADNREMTIFSALQAQLGLRLESSKAPEPAVLIDRAEKPSLN